MTSESIDGGRWNRPARAAVTDPECERLLRTMGIRQRAALAGVPLELVAQWHTALQHPGFQARFADPAAFAYTQLRQRLPPPTIEECERWTRSATAHDHARHYTPQTSDDAHYAALVAQARELAGDDDEQLVGLVLNALLEGMDAPAALTFAQTELAHQTQLESEEVYRALRARTTR